jgi:Na+/proline symporter
MSSSSINGELLPASLGFSLMIGTGLLMLIIALFVKKFLIRNTHDFIISDRKVGLGFGVGSIISVWTWAMAVLMSSAMTFQWGLSGLFWFVVPNGLALLAMIPLARIIRSQMPQGYTISQFAYHRFNRNQVAAGVVTVTMIFGVILEILINLKGTSVVMSTIFAIDWKVATIATVGIVLAYAFFGGLWTSVMTGTLNTWMITVPAAIVVVAVFSHFQGGTEAIFNLVKRQDASNLTVLDPAAAAGFGITLAFGLLAAVLADQTFWQKVWAIKKEHVTRSFLWAGILFYPIPIALGMLGLVGLALGVTTSDIGGDIAAIGPYVVSQIGLPLVFVIAYVLVILAACFSTIDGASSALSSIVAVDIVKRFSNKTTERTLFYITKISIFTGGIISAIIVLTGADFTSLVLTTYALKTSILLPLILAITWSRTTTFGFVSGVVLAIVFGMTIREFYGELIGTLSILAISGLTVVISGFIQQGKFDKSLLVPDAESQQI